MPEAGFESPAARFWLVDPLDGTKEFVAKNGEFAVLIGLIEDGRPVLGVVHGPAVGLTYTAHGPGTALRRRDGGAFEPIRARAPAPDGIVVVHSRTNAEQPPPRRVFPEPAGAGTQAMRQRPQIRHARRRRS